MAALVVIRGNSRSGKSTLARRLRTALPGPGTAVIGQDVVRRQILTPDLTSTPMRPPSSKPSCERSCIRG